MTAYCVKCRTKRTIENPRTISKNGRRYAKGTCGTCGTTVVRILSSKKKK